jgi:ATP-dependent helicase/nuclease subunit A
MSGFRPVDEDARERARADHATSLVLDAGAGTGKTTLLVERIEALVRSGRARLEEVAAVTFTENAATTMKLRLRERLERARATAGLPAAERARVDAALDVLERASVSTIHALCAQILQERPLECGVLPGFRMADEAQADALFMDTWEEWLGERLTGGDDVLLDALDRGIPLEGDGWGERTSLRGLARKLIDQRDLEPVAAESPFDLDAACRELLEKAARGVALAAQVREGDALGARLVKLGEFAEAARFGAGADRLAHLLRLETIPGNFGFGPHWPSPEALAEGRAIAAWTKEARPRWQAALGAELHGRLVRALAGVVAIYERKKAERGVLDFLDLLLKARDALRDHAGVRAWFQRRFRFLVIDEFQDTDPLQVEVARLLAGDRPGALVVVGDAKQSIYRFRRAEVRLFRELVNEAEQGASDPGGSGGTESPPHEVGGNSLASRPPAQAPLEESGSRVLHLTQNFRSRPAILGFVNRVFEGLIQASDEADQPAYEAIAPPPGLPEGPAVVGLRFAAPPNASGQDLLHAESGGLAAFLSGIAAGGESVRDPVDGRSRPSRAGDVLVLARRLTKVQALEDALEAAGLRFTVEGGKSFFDRQEVHETLAVLRAIDDPTDRIALVAALRSSFFGVSDLDILSCTLSGAPPWAEEVDETLAGAAALRPAVRLLRELHERRRHASVPAVLERLYDETRVLAALTGSRRGEAQVANLEKVAALARESSALGALTLRGFANLLEDRVHNAREEPDLPSTRPGDPHTVRVLSIHKAKGLEAPVVALFDTDDSGYSPIDTVPQWEEGRIAIGFRGGCQPPGWDALVRQEEKKARAEARRLLYVAATRARDLLIVPRPPVDAAVGAFWKELIGALPPQDDACVRLVDVEGLPRPQTPGRGRELWAISGAEGGDALAARWVREREDLVARGAARPFVPVSATRLAARDAPPAATPSGPGGRDFGSLVHRLLEWAPLEDEDAGRKDRVRAMAEALAPSYGLDRAAAGRAAAQVEATLGLPVVDRARRAPRVFRELKLWFPDGEHLVEGIVDLVFEEDGQLVVVDYKSDAIAEDQVLEQADHHAGQLRLYGRGLAQAFDLPVRERLVVFTAIPRAVPV